MPYPYGMRDIKVADLDGSNPVDLPAARTLTFGEVISESELEGDDIIVATVTNVQAVEWSLEEGGIDLDAYGKLTGRTPVDGGGGKITLSITAGDRFPYIRIWGQSLGAGDDDVHVKFFYAKVTSIEGSFGQGEFHITSCSGRAIGDGSDRIMDIVTHTTAEALDTADPV